MADPRNIEDLSDDEILALSQEDLAAMSATDGAPAADTTKEPDQPEAAAEAVVEANQEDGDDTNDNDETKKADEVAGAPVVEDENAADAGKPASAKQATSDAGAKDQPADKPADGKPADAAPATPAVVDADTQLKAILAPLKANGREIKIENVEEARQLMSMGAGFNKKMAALKPHLATVRMLENAGINSEQLSFLIDLHKKDPAAINKLVQDSKIDPMDLSAEKAAGYKPGDHKVSDAEVALEAVLHELTGSEGLARTLDVVTKVFDPASKQEISKNPEVLRVLNAHVENGIYDLVHTEIERQRVYGGLTGLSDLEAYRQVGDAMHAAGKFAHLTAGQPSKGQQAPAAPAVATPDPKKADDSKRNDARRAVAPVKASAPSKKAAPDFNPLSMSDEEFAKLGGKF